MTTFTIKSHVNKHNLILSLSLCLSGVEALATAGAGSMTITELMTTTTHLHTKTTTIGPSQLPGDQQAVGGAFLAGGGVASGEPTMGGVMPGQWGIDQSSSDAAGVQSQKKAIIQYRMYGKI